MRLVVQRCLRAALALLAVAVVAALVLVRAGFTALETTPRPVPPRAVHSWDEVLATTPRVTVEVLVTGAATGDRAMVLDPNDPALAELRDRFADSPVLAYRVHRPEHGDVLIDAGLSRAFAEGGGNYTAALRLLLWSMGSTARQQPGQDVASRLAAEGRVASEVFLTHLHADHTSGLADLACGIPAVFGAGEDGFLQKALVGDHLACRPLRTLDLASAPAMPPFDHAIDVLGDQSLWALSTPGHSPSHVSYLVHAKGGPLLVTGDAAAYHDQLAHRIRPAPGVHDAEAAAESLERLAEFVERYPQVRVAPGHELPVGRVLDAR